MWLPLGRHPGRPRVRWSNLRATIHVPFGGRPGNGFLCPFSSWTSDSTTTSHPTSPFPPPPNLRQTPLTLICEGRRIVFCYFPLQNIHWDLSAETLKKLSGSLSARDMKRFLSAWITTLPHRLFLLFGNFCVFLFSHSPTLSIHNQSGQSTGQERRLGADIFSSPHYNTVSTKGPITTDNWL